MRHAFLFVLLCGCAAPEPSPELMALSQGLLQPPAPKIVANTAALEEIKALTPAEFDEIEQQTPELPRQCTCEDCTCTDCQCKPSECHCPKPAKAPRYTWGPSHFRLTLYSESWCPPCQRMKRSTLPKLTQGIKVNLQPGSQMPTFGDNPKRQIPFSVLEYWTGTSWNQCNRWLGYTDASTINRAVDAKIASLRAPKQATQKRESINRAPKTDIRSWIRQNYRQGQRLTADVSPRTLVWSHLQNDHGFTQSQVQGLSLWEALALHDAAHRGVVSGRSF